MYGQAQRKVILFTQSSRQLDARLAEELLVADVRGQVSTTARRTV